MTVDVVADGQEPPTPPLRGELAEEDPGPLPFEPESELDEPLLELPEFEELEPEFEPELPPETLPDPEPWLEIEPWLGLEPTAGLV